MNTNTPPLLSIAEVLGIKPALRVWLGGNDLDARRIMEHALAGTVRPPTGPIDLAVICPETAEEAVYFVKKLIPRLAEERGIRIALRTSECAKPDDSVESFRNELTALGLRVAAVVQAEQGMNLFAVEVL